MCSSDLLLRILGAGWETRVGVGPGAMSLPPGDAPPASAGPPLPAPQSVPTLLWGSSAASAPGHGGGHAPTRDLDGAGPSVSLWLGEGSFQTSHFANC